MFLTGESSRKMRLTSLAIVAASLGVATGHFQLQYPLPRGPFVQDSEPTFCDGYNNAVSNRTTFPISNGVIELNSEHPTWTVGILISTAQDPTSWSAFNSSSGASQLVVPYFQTNGEGLYCFPINIAASNVSGIQNGANVTIQIVFDGGDGQLYQCADLTLSTNATVPGNATSSCTNVTATASASLPSATTSSSAAGRNMEISTVSALVLAGIALFL
ncbi:hypothetical protein JVU11DRAFT_5456 [Chiua virens]|nr:hypothetical protein JVU11DRAFT_5456 [Chiua virens]